MKSMKHNSIKQTVTFAKKSLNVYTLMIRNIIKFENVVLMQVSAEVPGIFLWFFTMDQTLIIIVS